MCSKKELKQMAKDDYLDCYEAGHYPPYISKQMSNDELESYANELELTLDEFKQYIEYFNKLCN